MSQAIVEHNYGTLKRIKPGDLIEFQRGYYSHWAVYIGEEHVVHLAVDGNDGLNANVNSGHIFTICGQTFNKANVCIADFWDVAGNSKAVVNNFMDSNWSPLDRQSIVDRALSKLGQIGYNVLWSNCEHFAFWCRYGKAKSDQVDKALKWSFVGVAFAGVIAWAIVSNRSTKNTEEEDQQVAQ